MLSECKYAEKYNLEWYDTSLKNRRYVSIAEQSLSGKADFAVTVFRM
jgi:hypothetical protein